jgi:hypothetical protein
MKEGEPPEEAPPETPGAEAEPDETPAEPAEGEADADEPAGDAEPAEVPAEPASEAVPASAPAAVKIEGLKDAPTPAPEADVKVAPKPPAAPDAKKAGGPAAALAASLRDAAAAAKRAAAARKAAAAKKGNAVYRISPEGIVSAVFEGKDAMLLALAAADGKLLVGTGQEARIYELALDGDEQASLANVDPKQVMALEAFDDGSVVFGTASPGRVYALSKGFAREGTYTSQVHDAGGSARWGALEWRAATPGGTDVRLATRTGNTQDPEKGFWSDWSGDATKSPARIASPAARFIQFRVTLRTNRDEETPVVEQLEAAYGRANEPPEIARLLVDGGPQPGRSANGKRPQPPQRPAPSGNAPGAAARKPKASPARRIVWQAADPNRDQLRYDLFFRGQGEPVWIPLAEDLTAPQFVWQTDTVADGWYELRLVASDDPDNPGETALTDEHVSDPVLVDNTAPVVERIDVRVRGKDVEVRLAATDAAARLTEAAWTVDSAEDWHVVVPEDGLFDAARETFRFTIRDLAPGPHRLALRVADRAGNTGHAARTVHIAP